MKVMLFNVELIFMTELNNFASSRDNTCLHVSPLKLQQAHFNI